MSLGHEPIHILRQSVTFFVLAAPHLCFGQGTRPVEENTWTSPAPQSGPQAEGARRPTQEGPGQPGEISDPWEGRPASGVDASGQPPVDAPLPTETLSDAFWEPYNEETPRLGPAVEPPFHGHAQPFVPTYSLWLGAGVGWTIPFGALWGTCIGFDAFGRCAAISSVSTRNYVGQGPGFELDLGARLARNYNLYGLWERTWLGAGDTASADRGQSGHGDTDFVALGLRVSTEPEHLGFVLDIAVGTRRMRAHWADGTELQLTDAPLETRIGIGADVRISKSWSLSPMLNLGLGSFGKAQWVFADKTVQSATQPGDIALTHGWIGLQVAAHIDAFGTK